MLSRADGRKLPDVEVPHFAAVTSNQLFTVLIAMIRGSS
jgi:hypothetical protein